MTDTQQSFTLVIFGATGNLAQLKLIPALYDLAESHLLPEQMSIVGIGRKPFTDDQFRSYSLDVLHLPNPHHQHPIKKEVADPLLARMRYIPGDMKDPQLYKQMADMFAIDVSCNNRMYYLATYPQLYASIFGELEKSGLNKQNCGWVRVIVEKPIGTDLKSAQQLNALLAKFYKENQIYRLDHYLGKETLQNILTFRFGNSIYEPLLNREHIDHIQVTASEDFGIKHRGGYYDMVGALRDVGQNHILQMITLATMDSPSTFTNAEITDKRIELLKQLIPDPTRIVYGQYEGYLDEPDVAKDSKTDTFFAFRTQIDSERFRDVPIYVRAGKSMAKTITEVAVVFKVGDNRLFKNVAGGDEPNVLTFRIQPNEGIVLRFLIRISDRSVKLHNEYMQYCYRNSDVMLPDPYLRLLVDVFHDDQTFFVDAPEVEAQWKFIDPLFAVRKNPIIYPKGSWGPEEANSIIEKDGRKWLEPSLTFCAL